MWIWNASLWETLDLHLWHWSVCTSRSQEHSLNAENNFGWGGLPTILVPLIKHFLNTSYLNMQELFTAAYFELFETLGFLQYGNVCTFTSAAAFPFSSDCIVTPHRRFPFVFTELCFEMCFYFIIFALTRTALRSFKGSIWNNAAVYK